MNDRYLFKAKRTDNGEWTYGYLYGIWERKYILWGMTNGKPDMIEVEPSTVCKCTALTDKNGVKIWEKDIVRYVDMITGIEKIDLIEWNETHASFVRLHKSQMGLQYLNVDEFIANGYEVIGSAIDNPKLFGGGIENDENR